MVQHGLLDGAGANLPIFTFVVSAVLILAIIAVLALCTCQGKSEKTDIIKSADSKSEYAALGYNGGGSKLAQSRPHHNILDTVHVGTVEDGLAAVDRCNGYEDKGYETLPDPQEPGYSRIESDCRPQSEGHYASIPEETLTKPAKKKKKAKGKSTKKTKSAEKSVSNGTEELHIYAVVNKSKRAISSNCHSDADERVPEENLEQEKGRPLEVDDDNDMNEFSTNKEVNAEVDTASSLKVHENNISRTKAARGSYQNALKFPYTSSGNLFSESTEKSQVNEFNPPIYSMVNNANKRKLSTKLPPSNQSTSGHLSNNQSQNLSQVQSKISLSSTAFETATTTSNNSETTTKSIPVVFNTATCLDTRTKEKSCNFSTLDEGGYELLPDVIDDTSYSPPKSTTMKLSATIFKHEDGTLARLQNGLKQVLPFRDKFANTISCPKNSKTERLESQSSSNLESGIVSFVQNTNVESNKQGDKNERNENIESIPCRLNTSRDCNFMPLPYPYNKKPPTVLHATPV